jgi:1-acyl-sn-glycerol-3-phosphate acyltransferase
MYYFIITLYAWLEAFLSFIVFFPIVIVIWLITLPFDRNLKILHVLTSIWGSSFTWVNPLWDVTIYGRKKILPKQTYIMVSNHQSLLDIWVIFRLFTHFKWVSKASLFQIPIVGWTMALNQYVSVKRGNKRSHLKMIKECEKNLKNGNSLMIFPEGTRSEDGKIQHFKDGAFMLAQSVHVPIIPIVVEGTSNALPKKGFIFKGKQVITVKVLDPIPYDTFANLSTKELTDKVRAIMIENMDQH